MRRIPFLGCSPPRLISKTKAKVLCSAVDQNFVFLRGFFRTLLCLLINRPRARAREAINPIQSWIVGVTAKGAAIQRTTRCRVAGRRYFAESPLDGLKP